MVVLIKHTLFPFSEKLVLPEAWHCHHTDLECSWAALSRCGHRWALHSSLLRSEDASCCRRLPEAGLLSGCEAKLVYISIQICIFSLWYSTPEVLNSRQVRDNIIHYSRAHSKTTELQNFVVSTDLALMIRLVTGWIIFYLNRVLIL